MSILLIYQNSSYMFSKSGVINSRPRSNEFILFFLFISLIILDELISVFHSTIDLLFRYCRIIVGWSRISYLICWHIKHFLGLLKSILLSRTMLRYLIIMRSWSDVFCWKRFSYWFVKLCTYLVLWFVFFNFICSRTRIFYFRWLEIAFV